MQPKVVFLKAHSYRGSFFQEGTPPEKVPDSFFYILWCKCRFWADFVPFCPLTRADYPCHRASVALSGRVGASLWCCLGMSEVGKIGDMPGLWHGLGENRRV